MQLEKEIYTFSPRKRFDPGHGDKYGLSISPERMWEKKKSQPDKEDGGKC